MNAHSASTEASARSALHPPSPGTRAALPSAPAKAESFPALFEGWAPEDVDLIRRTIAPDAGEHELALYLKLCRTYELDPFRKELILEKRRRKRQDGGYDVVPVFITTRDGYLKAAMRDPDYAGLVGGVVCEGDHFEYIADEFKVVHRFGAKRGPIIGAWAIAYHKERPPIVGFVPFKEYAQGTEVWQRTPTAMIQKCGEVFVLRRQFNITGIVAREEIDEDIGESGTRLRRRKPADPSLSSGAPTTPSLPGTEPHAAIDDPRGAADAGRSNDPAAGMSGSVSTPESRTDQFQGDTAPSDLMKGAQKAAELTLSEGSGESQSGRLAPSPKERDEIQRLVAQAALADGFKLVRRQNGGNVGPGQQWLQQHYGTDKLDQLVDRFDEIRARARKALEAAQGYQRPNAAAPEILNAVAPPKQLASPSAIAELSCGVRPPRVRRARTARTHPRLHR